MGTWIVALALLVGKPVGIVLSTVLSIKAGLRAPGGLTTAHTVVLGVAAGTAIRDPHSARLRQGYGAIRRRASREGGHPASRIPLCFANGGHRPSGR